MGECLQTNGARILILDFFCLFWAGQSSILAIFAQKLTFGPLKKAKKNQIKILTPLVCKRSPIVCVYEFLASQILLFRTSIIFHFKNKFEENPAKIPKFNRKMAKNAQKFKFWIFFVCIKC